MQNKNRMVWDECTPTAERRETTLEDVENDINVMDFDSAEDLYNFLLEREDMTDEEWVSEIVDDEDREISIFEKVNNILGMYNDPGDGSINVQYCVIDGQESEEAYPYDCFENVNFDTVTKDTLIDIIKNDYDFDSYDEDEEDDYDEDDLNEDYPEDEEDDYDPIHFSKEDLKQYIISKKHPESTITDSEIDELTDIVLSEALEEALISGDEYLKPEEIYLGELADTSSGRLPELYYKLLALDNDEAE